MLYRETQPGTFTAWAGEPINDIRHPLTIEQAWSDADLAAIGLYKPIDPGIPDGKVSTGSTVERSGRDVVIVYTLEDAPTTSYQLTKRQICAALILAGVTVDPDGWMTGLLDNIVDPVQRALAVNDWHNAPFYDRTNTLFSDPGLMAAAGMTSAQIDALWLSAKDLPK